MPDRPIYNKPALDILEEGLKKAKEFNLPEAIICNLELKIENEKERLKSCQKKTEQ